MSFFSVGLIGEKSTRHEHSEAIVNFDKALKNKIEGQYRIRNYCKCFNRSV
ncbi:hypothetical protein D3C86_378410 [compost metagenome]